MKRLIAGLAIALALAGTTRAAEWFVLGDGWWTNNLAHPAAQKLKEIYSSKDGSANTVAFSPNNDWVVTFGGNGVWTSNLEQPVIKKLVSLMDGHTLHCIAFTAGGGGAVLFDKNGYWAEHIPADAFKKLGEVAKSGGTLRSIAFSPTGGWVILFDNHGAWYGGLPDDLAPLINQAVEAKNPIHCVSFTNTGDWFLLTANGWWTSNLGHPAAKEIGRLDKEGRKPRWVAVAPEDPPLESCFLESKPSQKIKATLVTDIAHPNAQVDEWYVYAPHVPSLPSQHGTTTAFDPPGRMVDEASPLHQSLILTRIADGRKEFHSTLMIETTLMSRHLRALLPGQTPPNVPDLSAADVEHFTRASFTANYDSKGVREWLDKAGLHRKDGERDIEFALRAFAYIKHHFTYQWPTPTNQASKVCAAGKSDCGGLSALFVATMRAGGVPARLLGGRWASSQKPGDKTGDYGQWHVKAEFFAHNIGWVPVDASSAVGDTNGRDRAFFGNDNGDHLAMAIDEDLQLNSFISGVQNIGVVQGLVYWWRGSGADKDNRYNELWTVETVPAGR